jgi:integrase
MATVNFYLKEPITKENEKTRIKKETLIFLKFYCSSFKFRFSTGEKVHPDYWNSKTQSVRKNFEGAPELNDFLENLSKEAIRLYRISLVDDTLVSQEKIKTGLLIFMGKSEVKKKLKFFEAFKLYLEIKKGKYSINYLKATNTLLKHLLNFEKVKKYDITFEKIDFNFYELFTNYLLNDCKLVNNTIGTNISQLKNFLSWSTEMKYNSNLFFKDKKFKASQKASEIICLTNEELFRIYDLDLTKNKKLNNLRDSFCFGCFTGLRFSDISAIRRNNVFEDDLIITTQKTKEQIEVPLNEFALSILERNDYKLPVVSNQKTNEYLKELGKLANLNESIKITKFRGVERIEIVEPKYNFISSHTARRTFVTLSLEKGMNAEEVMEITGHKNYKTFKKYISLTSKVKKIAMKRAWNRTPEQTLKAI